MEETDSYINKVFIERADVLEGVLAVIGEKGMQPILISPASRKRLPMTEAERALEIDGLLVSKVKK
ncbi:hypothetical protein BBI15_13915 [Planococcus plakortidis]|uniref:Uncharacterized protein n=1 Tax=Planococcus plakortidis TaxID=1038856 RepID=A0A1C7ECS4_9BACL|nr:hypothetical protein [Planococcus plakortidis]ANU21202.1 hypothetical protein BBI15_13915 [Planococcus plakortidis]